ncbi:hypothetical protein OP10G_2438 [Fimbriimonas ginsengisoli Gsoil 348]|uniref:Uncharacterized protein n=1 Tax=Fimbriimonas ginsengisoli Gsoil 348 TaxID=661478 RepID=A0A068NQT5_FIMGI|nr:hypothetical protein OP10G_2438 [Fimbriimonas ginsengisoli Gsoil 348]
MTPASPPSAGTAMVAADPAQKLYEQLHAAAFQFSTASDNLNDAVAALRPLPGTVGGDTKEALLNALDGLDSTGRTLVDMAQPPEQQQVRQDQAASEKQRAKWVEEGIDAIRELRDASDTVGDLIESKPPPKEAAALDEADGAISDALDAMEDAIKLLGGTVPPESTEGQ